MHKNPQQRQQPEQYQQYYSAHRLACDGTSTHDTASKQTDSKPDLGGNGLSSLKEPLRHGGDPIVPILQPACLPAQRQCKTKSPNTNICQATNRVITRQECQSSATEFVSQLIEGLLSFGLLSLRSLTKPRLNPKSKRQIGAAVSTTCTSSSYSFPACSIVYQ